MSKNEWLDTYSGQTVDELIALEGKYRTDSLVLAFEQALELKAVRVGSNNLTVEERVILAIEALEREVNNGGYDQFFVNSSREYMPIISDALQRIGCPKTAAITKIALRIESQNPLTDGEIESSDSAENVELQEALNACDRMFYESEENIDESLFAFIKDNRTKIEL